MVQSISKKSWSHLALLLLIIMSLKAHHTTASDTIFPGTNSSMPNPTVAVLLDNGNFILRDNLDNVLWQSFEEQTNTWLPGAKIRYNRHNNRSNILVSWRNYESPDSGQYYVELKVEENGTAYLVLYNGKTRIVSNEELNNPYINASYVSNNNESYFIYSAISPSTFTRFVLEVTGTLSFLVWDKDLRQWNLVRNWMTKKPPCDCLNGFKPKYPGSGDNSGGCERRNPLQCSDGGIDEFLVMPNMRFPEASKHPPKVNNVEECKLQCLIDCYCTAYAYKSGANMEELTRACKVACWCIQDDPKDRPTMGQVVKILEGVMQVGIPQIPLYFQRLSENPTEMIVYHETGTSLSSY
ncbi:g-type lectin s-receptor-like serine/threonine-protein kinase [Fagus crenata]